MLKQKSFSEVMAFNHWQLRGLLCILVFSLAASNYKVVFIGHLKVQDQESSFKTIDDFLENDRVENFTSIVLLDGVTNISTTLSISKVHDVSITGNDTRVYCLGNNSGLVFRLASNIQIIGVSFLNCGSVQDSTSTDFRIPSGSATLHLKSALYFHYCTNISITSATFENNTGIAVVIYDSKGTIVISECTFRGNKVAAEDRERIGGGGGVHIEITSCPVGFADSCNVSQYGVDVDNSLYVIQHCAFTENIGSTLLSAVSSYISLEPGHKQGLGRGGGLYTKIGRSAFNISVTISDCSFTRNNAVFGGGVFVIMENSARNNTVTVEDCNVTDNVARESGGGVYMLYASRSPEMRNNIYSATGITFKNNSAKYHGGMFFMNVFKGTGRYNNMQMSRCDWIENSAFYGAALGVVSRSGISYEDQTIELDSCSFSRNIIVPQRYTIDYVVHSLNKRAVVSVSFEYLSFRGNVTFEDNIGSALWVMDSVVKFLPSTFVLFANNCGHQGGAIGLIGNSLMLVNSDSQFHFQNNTAVVHGGAMFLKSHDERNPYSIASAACPLQFEGEYAKREGNVSFYFVNNTAGVSGNSIYFTTLDSCVYLCTHNTSTVLNVTNVFKCIGELHYNGSSKDEFSTFNYNFRIAPNTSYMTNGTILAVPGRLFELSVGVVDQLNNLLDAVYIAEIDPLNGSSAIYVDQASKCVSDSMLRVYGSPNSRGVLKLVNKGFFRFSVELNITLLPCPPAYESKFTTVNNVPVQSCECIVINSNLYQGIYCGNDADELRAYLIHGYWAGYVSNTNTAVQGSDNFFISLCPTGFCDYYNKTEFKRHYLIPSMTSLEVSKQQMEDFVCGLQRRGVLCGECRPNWSVYFHSPEYRCYPDKLCSMGWLFYIVSELMPLTILFVSVILFDISFTSGSISGFILFAQTADLLIIFTRRYDSSSLIDVFTSICEVIYSFFNLNFFGINSLSYCLLRGGNALDIIALKFVTIVYAVVLVAITILVMKRTRKCSAKFTRNGTMTHGLSAFLILCYAQCVQVSIRLLLATRLYSANSSQLRVHYNGEIISFSLRHLPYALPALLCLVLIVIPPPVILLWHPLGKYLLSRCGLGESVLVRAIDKVLLVDKLKPVLDSFQSCFKDSCRYFAGVHFIYRLSLFTTLLFGRDTQFYIWILVHSSVMLLAHATIQPYKRKLHNMVDGLLFANLLFINIISLSTDMKLKSDDRNVERYILIASIFQLFLISIPIIGAIGCCIFCIVRFIRRNRSKPDEDTDLDFSYRLVRSDSNEISMRELKHD